MTPISTAGPLAERAIIASPLGAWFKRRASDAFTVLAYHDVSDPALFAKQMDYAATHFNPVSLEDVSRAVRGGTALPPRALLVTFDDGYRSVLEEGMPILQARSIPAVVYVVADIIGTDAPFWVTEVRDLVRMGAASTHIAPEASPDEAVRRLKRVPNSTRLLAIEELRASATGPAPRMPQLEPHELHTLIAGGIEIGNHTHTHPCLHQCDAVTIQRELAASQEALTEMLGWAPTSFAYPNGDHDPRVLQAVQEMGFETAFLFDHAAGPLRPPEPLRISRYRVDTTTPMSRFVSIVSGLHPALHRLRGGA